jgi:hypothetical protein
MSSPPREPRIIALPAVIKKRKAEPMNATPTSVRRLFEETPTEKKDHDAVVKNIIIKPHH